MLFKNLIKPAAIGCICILALSINFSIASAQSDTAAKRTCATMEVLEQQLVENPQMAQKMADLETFTQKYIDQLKTNRLSGLEGLRVTRTIPVYVHVLHQTTEENIDTAQIQSQLTVLNQDFRRMASTPGFGNTGYVSGVDTNINFVLAPVPAGSASGGTVDAAGINRKYVDRDTWGLDDDMKKSSMGGIDPVSPDTHMNMWICDIGVDTNGIDILGYAQFPGGPAETDGVVFSPQYCGSSDIYPDGYYEAPFDKGRTATHEVGHYLNLRHIWGDGDCGVDDFVVDTPVSDAANFQCPTDHVSCTTIDMTENYMDYTDDACMNTYTEGQADRMSACLTANRNNLGSTSQPACTDGIQNGDETGIDCGGSCPVCVSCEGTVTLSLTTGAFGEEISWNLEYNSSIIESGTDYADYTTYTFNWSLTPGDYIFTINDSYGDGIEGGYSLSDSSCGNIANGGPFGFSASHPFTITEEGKIVLTPVMMLLLNK